MLTAGQYEGAYYLAGYAVECALKSCIARQTQQHDFPPKPEFVRRLYSHELGDLLRVAGLALTLDVDSKTDPALGANWDVVEGWSEQSRYARPTESQARQLHDAIVDPSHGVLQWLHQHW